MTFFLSIVLVSTSSMLACLVDGLLNWFQSRDPCLNHGEPGKVSIEAMRMRELSAAQKVLYSVSVAAVTNGSHGDLLASVSLAGIMQRSHVLDAGKAKYQHY